MQNKLNQNCGKVKNNFNTVGYGGLVMKKYQQL